MITISHVLGVSSGSNTAIDTSTHLIGLAKKIDKYEDEHWDEYKTTLYVGPVQQYLGPAEDCPIENNLPSFVTQVSALWVEVLEDFHW